MSILKQEMHNLQITVHVRTNCANNYMYKHDKTTYLYVLFDT